MRAGVAAGTITPALGTWMSGFGARTVPADTIHDDLGCVALALDDGRRRLGLVSCDLVGLPVPLAHSWRRELAERSGIPAEHILLSCTHSHSGPVTGMLWDTVAPGPRELAYLEQVKHALAGALEVAVARSEPARLRLAHDRVRTQFNRRSRLGTGRRDQLGGPPGPVDDTLGLLCVERADGRPLALVVSHACHPTNVGAASTGFSGEYPGWVRRAVDQALGVPCLFLQGACGDHNPLSRTEPGPEAQQTGWQLAAARSQGTTIADAAVRLAAAATPMVPAADGGGGEPEVLGAALRTFQAPLAALPSAEEVAAQQAAADRRLAEAEAAGAPETTLVYLRRLCRWPLEVAALLRDGALPAGSGLVSADQSVPFEVQALRIGPLAMVGLPVEPLSAIGLALRAMRGGEPVWCAGYANGCYGYLAPEAEYARGGYEVEQAFRYYRRPAPFAPSCAALVIQEATAALAQLF